MTTYVEFYSPAAGQDSYEVNSDYHHATSTKTKSGLSVHSFWKDNTYKEQVQVIAPNYKSIKHKWNQYNNYTVPGYTFSLLPGGYSDFHGSKGKDHITLSNLNQTGLSLVDGGASKDVALLPAKKALVSISTNDLGFSKVDTSKADLFGGSSIYLLFGIEKLDFLDHSVKLKTTKTSYKLKSGKTNPFDGGYGPDYNKSIFKSGDLLSDKNDILSVAKLTSLPVTSLDFAGGKDVLVISEPSTNVDVHIVGSITYLHSKGASAVLDNLEYLQFIDQAYQLNASTSKFSKLPFYS